jgi:hypothetical protein
MPTLPKFPSPHLLSSESSLLLPLGTQNSEAQLRRIFFSFSPQNEDLRPRGKAHTKSYFSFLFSFLPSKFQSQGGSTHLSPLLSSLLSLQLPPLMADAVANGTASMLDVKALFKQIYSDLKNDLLQDPAFDFTPESRQWIDKVLSAFSPCFILLVFGISTVVMYVATHCLPRNSSKS